ncbi:hypothetical protein DY000_02027470 [Brassica cretica]|nr:hypothetical protein DY000_02027470 [Brassica cretica]
MSSRHSVSSLSAAVVKLSRHGQTVRWLSIGSLRRTWMFCVVGVFLWLVRHDGLLSPNLIWTIVSSLRQGDGSRLYLIIGEKMDWLCEDMWWKMMV